MSVRTDVVNLIVNVNGNQAQAQLNSLRKRSADLKLEMGLLKKGTEEYISKAKELAGVNAEMDKLKKQIGITALSQKELVAELNKLKALKGSVAPFSKEFKDLDVQIKSVEKRLYDVRNGVQGFSSVWSRVNDQVKQFGVLAAGYLGFQFISSQFSNIIRGAGKMSDQLTDLQRASGLTAEEVKALNDQFKEFDTRTNTETLRSIANIAARLGVGKEDIAGFTKEFDKLVVVLGNSLGDADAAASTLGKILNVFDGKITGDNISRLGNAIVSLDQSGVASGAFLADFAQRLSGVSKNANLSLGSLLGLGAGIEEMGGRVESGSTAIQKIITSIASDIPKAAKIAGKDVKEFANTFATAPQEAIIQFAEGLVKNKSSFAEITASFKDAGEEGARVVTTLSNIGNSGELMRKRIADANIAIQDTATINEGFRLKNENFAATLDKLGKEFNRLVASPAVTNFLKGAIEGALAFVKAIRNLPQFITDNRIAIITLVAGVALLNKALIVSAAVSIRDAAAKAYNAIVTRLVASSTGLASAATAAYITITNLLTGRITLATAAQRLWNIALSFGAAGLGTLLVAAGGVLLLISSLTGKTKELTAAQKNQQDVQEKLLEITKEEETTARSLFNQITKSNLGYDEKKKLLNQLIAISPDYLKGLTLENINTAEGAKILDKYIEKLRQVNEQKAIARVIDDKEAKRQDLQNKIDASFVDVKDAQGNVVGKEVRNKDNSVLGAVKSLFGKNEVENVQAARAELNGINSELDDLYKKVKDKPLGEAITGNTGDGATGGATKTGTAGTGKSEFAQLKADAAAYLKELNDLKKKAKIEGLEPEQEEIAAIQKKYDDLIERLKEYYIKNALTKKQYTDAEKTLEEAHRQELQNIFDKYQKKRFEDGAAQEYEQSLELRREFSIKLKAQVAQEYAEGKISKEQYERELKKIDRNETADRIIIATDYSATVKKAAKDVTTFKKEQEKQQTEDLRSEAEERTKLSRSEALAKAQRGVLTAKPGSDARLEANKKLLKLQFEQETEFLDKKSELYQLKEQELNDGLTELRKQHLTEQIERILTYVSYFQDALTNLNQFINNSENRKLQKEKTINDAKRKSYKEQLDGKLISQSIYDKKITLLQEEEDKRNKEIKRRQAKREKALNLFNAVVNTAAAVIKSLVDPGGLAGVALSIAAGITGALQIAAIANTPLPEAAKGNWFTKGKTHAQGGIPVEIERNEAVMTAAAMESNKRFSVTGTTAQITSALNSHAGGVNWAGGAIVREMKHINERGANLNPNLPGMLQHGAIVRPIAAGNSNAKLEELLSVLLVKTDENTNAIATMKTNLKANFSYRELMQKADLYNQAKKASGL